MSESTELHQEDGEDLETSSEENAHRRAIEQEKIVYRESFERLRVLKPEIEHIRKVYPTLCIITDRPLDLGEKSNNPSKPI